jgi:hypothetical protein
MPVPGTPVPIAPPPGYASVYPLPPSSVAAAYIPEVRLFIQIGALDATLLLGIVAGYGTLVVDELRRRRVRKASQRGQASCTASEH